jgi:5'-nucleotidase
MRLPRTVSSPVTLTAVTAALAIPVLFLTAPTAPAAVPAAAPVTTSAAPAAPGTTPAATPTTAPVTAAVDAAPLVKAQILAINDFHGHLEPDDLSISTRTGTSHGKGYVPAGGAAYLKAKINAARKANPASVVVSAGDLIGGSPMISGYYHDESTIEAMNQILDVATVGNHEFDEGTAELRRLVAGGCHPVDGCQDETGFAGTKFDLLAANVIDKSTRQPILPAFTIKDVGGAKIGFIGTVTTDTPRLVNRNGVAEVSFKDEAATIRTLVPQVRAAGADAVVVLTHSGAAQTERSPVNGCRGIVGPAYQLAKALKGQVDAVVSAHTHQSYICDVKGVQLTSAASYGRLLTTVKLTIDPNAHRVTRISAANSVVSHKLKPAKDVAATVARYHRLIAPIANRTVGRLSRAADRIPSKSGETVLGDLLADAQLRATAPKGKGGAQIALVAHGLIRTDLAKGRVTYGAVYASQPFGQRLVTMTLTGRQLDAALETQFCNPAAVHEDDRVPLAVSKGFRYSYDPHGRCGHLVRIRDFRLNGKKVTAAGKYRVTIIDLLAAGESGFTVLPKGTQRVIGVLDRDAAASYLKAHPKLPTRTRVKLR